MKQIVREYFSFNKRERNGVFVLLTIIFLMIVYLNVAPHFFQTEKVDFSNFEKTFASLNAIDSTELDFSEKKKFVPERFVFNPNQLPAEDWKRLGLTEKQIKTINNYEAKGGKFKSSTDFKKMYCIPDELYLSLKPFIQIKDKEKKAEPIIEKIKTVIIELNSADSAQLTTIKGIGPFYAKAIIKYRNQLGGFVKKEQVMEVWKFDQEKFNGIEKFVSVDASLVKKININTCKSEELKHPYLSWNMANAIVNYRNSHGKYKIVDDIQKTDLVDGETLRKIAPYLVIE